MIESLFIHRAIKNITLLRTFDANGDIDEFKGVAKNEFGDLMCLPGPGKHLTNTLRYICCPSACLSITDVGVHGHNEFAGHVQNYHVFQL